VHLHDRELSMRASFGIASGKTTEEGARGSPANADVALYMAKGASIARAALASTKLRCRPSDGLIRDRW
jgi:predicted signal transduction protein with EAL and GGDEF domain